MLTFLGYWLFHCHIEFHVEVGMATVFKIGEDRDMPPLPPGFPKCGNYNGKELVSFIYSEDIGMPFLNTNESNILDLTNDSSINMISTLGKWWPFVGGAHPYVSSIGSANKPLYFSFLICIVISIFLNK